MPYLFGHAGIAVGVGYLAQRLFARRKICSTGFSVSSTSSSTPPPPNSLRVGQLNPNRPWVPDLRLILIGAMLPDLVDKITGPYLFSATRALGHTPMLNLTMVIFGSVLLWQKGRKGFLIFSLASLFHILQDRIWETSQILFWPFYGVTMPPLGIKSWGQRVYELTHFPGLYLPEIFGISIGIALALLAWKRKCCKEFLRRGVLS